MSHRLNIDPIACTGRGICAELLPEMIDLDEWGYPIIDKEPVPRHLAGPARLAVRDCPMLALRLERATRSSGASRSTPRPARSRT